MNALDDARLWVVLADAGAEGGGVAITFGDKNGVGAFEVLDGLAQGASGEELLVAEGELRVNENNIAPTAGKFPVLESVIQQQGVTAEFLDGVSAGLHSVFVHQYDNIFEIGGEHIGLVAGILRIEQQVFCIGNHAGRRVVFLKQQLGTQALQKGWRFGAISA